MSQPSLFSKNILMLCMLDFMSLCSPQHVCPLCDEAKAALESYRHRVGWKLSECYKLDEHIKRRLLCSQAHQVFLKVAIKECK